MNYVIAIIAIVSILYIWHRITHYFTFTKKGYSYDFIQYLENYTNFFIGAVLFAFHILLGIGLAALVVYLGGQYVEYLRNA